MARVKIRTTQNIDLEYETANVGLRMVAYIIDVLVFFAVLGIYGLIIYLIYLATGTDLFGSSEAVAWIVGAIGVLLIFVFYVFYDLLCEALMHGQSIGKKAMNIKVVKLDGSQPTLGDYTLRWLLRAVDFQLFSTILGTVLVAFTEKNQRLGDMAAGTTVISLNEPPQFDQTIFVETEKEEEEYEIQYPQVSKLTDADVQLIKQILTESRKTDNSDIILKLSNKMQDVLEVVPRHAPRPFIEALLKDYNYINNDFDDGTQFY